jgi:hypothetical protein
MIGMLAWWAVLWLPGHAIARRFARDDLGGGALASVGLGYLYSFALLTPVSLLGYAFGWPIAVLAIVAVLAALAGGVDLARTKFWREWRASALLDVAVLAALIVVADLAFGAYAGGHTAGDARFHVARARILLDHGFNNWDPFFADRPFSRVYHTNLYHPLIAAGAWLTGSLAVEAWVWTLPWAKLVGAAGVAFLAWRVLDSRLAAWLAAAAWCIAHAPITFAVYPNQLAPWLVALGLALVVAREGRTRPRTIELACCFLVVAQVHSLYGIALALAVGPLLLWRALAALWRRDGAWRHAVLALLAPALLAPFLLATKYVGRDAADRTPAPAAIQAAANAARATDDDDEVDEDGPAPIETDRSVVAYKKLGKKHLWLLAALLLGLASPKRIRVRALAAASVTVLLALHVQPLSSLLAEALGNRPWAVRRMGVVLRLAAFVMLPGVLIAFARTARARQMLTGTLLVLCTAWWVRAGWRPTSYWGLPRYLNEAHDYSATALRKARKKTTVLRRTIPPGSTILANASIGRSLVSLYDLHVISIDNPSPGIPGAGARKRDLDLALDPGTSWETQREIVQRHHVRYLVTRRNYRHPRYANYLERAGAGIRAGGLTVIDLGKL